MDRFPATDELVFLPLGGTGEIGMKALSNADEVGSPLQGRLSKVLVKIGEKIEKNTQLFAIEAMKMESTVLAPKAGVVKSIYLKDGSLIEQDDAVLEIV